jgi:O-antigen/teichoic acid export membrane protein
MIPDAVVTTLLPRVAEDVGSGRARAVARGARLSILTSGAALALVTLLARPLVRVLFSPAFMPIVPVTRLLAVGILVRSGCKVFVPYFAGTDRPGTASWSVVVGVGVNVALLWLLLPRMGLMGAAWSTVIGYIVSSGVLLFWFGRYTGMSMREIWAFERADWAPIASQAARAWRSVRPAWSVGGSLDE